MLLSKMDEVSPVVALGSAVVVELAITDTLGAVPAVVAAEHEVGGLVGQHGAVGQRLFKYKKEKMEKWWKDWYGQSDFDPPSSRDFSSPKPETEWRIFGHNPIRRAAARRIPSPRQLLALTTQCQHCKRASVHAASGYCTLCRQQSPQDRA